MNQASKSGIQENNNKMYTNSKSKELIKINTDISELANKTGRTDTIKSRAGSLKGKLRSKINKQLGRLTDKKSEKA